MSGSFDFLKKVKYKVFSKEQIMSQWSRVGDSKLRSCTSTAPLLPVTLSAQVSSLLCPCPSLPKGFPPQDAVT